MISVLQPLIERHAKVISATGLEDDGRFNDALVWFERIWSDDETTWPNPELLDNFVSKLEEQWIESSKRHHEALLRLFEDFLTTLEETGAFIEEMDWMDVEEALLDGLDATE